MQNQEPEEQFKIPKLTHKDWKYLMYGLVLICAVLIIFSVVKLYKMKQCADEGGFSIKANDNCYIPKNEAERQQIIKTGQIRVGGGFDVKSINTSYWEVEK